jgi:hypothetical protein
VGHGLSSFIATPQAVPQAPRSSRFWMVTPALASRAPSLWSPRSRHPPRSLASRPLFPPSFCSGRARSPSPVSWRHEVAYPVGKGERILRTGELFARNTIPAHRPYGSELSDSASLPPPKWGHASQGNAEAALQSVFRIGQRDRHGGCALAAQRPPKGRRTTGARPGRASSGWINFCRVPKSRDRASSRAHKPLFSLFCRVKQDARCGLPRTSTFRALGWI